MQSTSRPALNQDAEQSIRRLEVPIQMDRLDDAIDAFGKTIIELEERLGQILRPSEPADNDGKPHPALVPFAEQLSLKVEGIQAWTARLQGILQRLEV